MEENRQPRKRIPIAEHKGVPVSDPLEWVANKSSPKVRSAANVQETIAIDLAYDKHYLDREQHGDELGQREGISQAVVQDLVLRSIKHLLFYSGYVANFKFLNRVELGGPVIRTLCKESTPNGMLNVAIEAHYIGLNRYEITVKTAMCVDDFRLSDGQYAIELHGDGSTLSRMVKKKLEEILTI